jgi:hypothetical protein
VHFPERAARVMNRIREMRGGKGYDADFATRMRGEGVWTAFVAPARPPRTQSSGQFEMF